MAKKSVVTGGWAESTITFFYGGDHYLEEIADNFTMEDLSIMEIKEKLNELPGKFAYWKSFQSSIELEIEELDEQYTKWYAQAYLAADNEAPKGATETYKKNAVILDNKEDYDKFREKRGNLKRALGQIEVIVKSLDKMSFTLQALASLTQSEMRNIEVRGAGSLSDI